MGQRRQGKESVLPLINEKEELAATDVERAELLSEFFASDITASQDFHISYILESHIPKPLYGNWGSKLLPTLRAREV